MLLAGLILLGLLSAAPLEAAPIALFVATDGNDAWSGKLQQANPQRTDGPFRTLERARNEIRKLQAAALPQGGVVVEVQPGIYECTAPLELSAQDSGAAQAPILYRASSAGEVRLVGGKVVTGWQPVTDPNVLRRMDPSAIGHVLQADLKALGMLDLGKMEPGAGWGASRPGLEVFFRNEPMTLARWPNQDVVTIPEVLGSIPQDIRGTKGCMDGVFSYQGDRPTRWLGEDDVMLHGYWFWDWADQRLRVASIDTERHVIRLERKPQHSYGFRKGMYYYAYNLLPELDRPGEWYLDRKTGILYFWPPAQPGQEDAVSRAAFDKEHVLVSLVPTLLRTNGAKYVTFHGFFFECTRDTTLSIAGADHVRIEACTIRNSGSWGVNLSGKESGVVACNLYNLADGGVQLSGGDRKKLIPAGLYVDNCDFHHFGRWNPICKPGVQVNGVGNRVTHCHLHDAPHMAVMWGGNDHLFEYNEMNDVVRNANDAGIMYAGYDPTMRGHMIRFNYFHHVSGYRDRGCNGVYLDDMFCSATMYGNIFYKVPRAAFIGGGHDNVVENNIFVDCKPAIHVDARALGWAAPGAPQLLKRLDEMPYRDEPWRTRFPQLLTYRDGQYAAPGGNLIVRNICWGGRWDEVEKKATPGVAFTDNLVNQDPRFVAPEQANFQLRDDSPAWKLGFQRIPVEKIGLYQDALRPRLPATTKRP